MSRLNSRNTGLSDRHVLVLLMLAKNSIIVVSKATAILHALQGLTIKKTKKTL
jgi:hypothetical protein